MCAQMKKIALTIKLGSKFTSVSFLYFQMALCTVLYLNEAMTLALFHRINNIPVTSYVSRRLINYKSSNVVDMLGLAFYGMLENTCTHFRKKDFGRVKE